MSFAAFRGIAASEGIAIAEAFVLGKPVGEVPKRSVVSPDLETARLQQAVLASACELEQLFEHTKQVFGEEKAEIIEGQLFLLQDPAWLGQIEQEIAGQAVNAEWALDTVTRKVVQTFASMDNEYMRERASDIRDVSSRIMSKLLGVSQGMPSWDRDVILVTEDLTPSQAAQLDRERVAGFVTEIGGRTSHSAILARSLEIPAVTGIEGIASQVKTGDWVIIDGIAGQVYVRPDAKLVEDYRQKQAEFVKKKELLNDWAEMRTVTADGTSVELAANIGSVAEVAGALRNGAEGIGLFRSEFLFLNRDSLPGEEEQFQAYREAAERMNGKPVIIRTLDIGGDKELPHLQLPKEMNPFLGYRAIRLCLDRKEMFKTQLRAILRAGHYGNLKIMFPMIATLEEVLQAKNLLEECKRELQEAKISHKDDIEIGIMIEIPSAALVADSLAKEVQFFSIGSNDLIQYTMACDRMNESISYLYQPYHPSVLRLVKLAADAAHRYGRWVGICGEMAADQTAVPILLGLGLDELSMSAGGIPATRRLIRSWKLTDMKRLAEAALECRSQHEVRELVRCRTIECCVEAENLASSRS